MFHFPALPHTALCIQAAATAHDGRRVSPFGNPRITAWLPAPRGISQAPASFIGSWCQGIHRVPYKTWHNKIALQKTEDARVHCAVLKIRAATAPVQRVRAGWSRSCPRPVPNRPFPQDPTVCPEALRPRHPRSEPSRELTSRMEGQQHNRIASAPLGKLWTPARTLAAHGASSSLERR